MDQQGGLDGQAPRRDQVDLRPGATATYSCTLDLEQTPDSLHAYCDLAGVAVGPGDEVLILDGPASIAFGERKVVHCRAEVRRAGALRRFWAHLEGYLELTELFEVSFSDGRAT